MKSHAETTANSCRKATTSIGTGNPLTMMQQHYHPGGQMNLGLGLLLISYLQFHMGKCKTLKYEMY